MWKCVILGKAHKIFYLKYNTLLRETNNSLSLSGRFLCKGPTTYV